MNTRTGKVMGIFVLLLAFLFLLVACLGGSNSRNGGVETAQYLLTISETEGEGTVDPEEGTYRFYEGRIVNLDAFPAEGWRFEEWEGDVADRSSQTTTVLMNSDKIVKAVFVMEVVDDPDDPDEPDDPDDSENKAVYVSSVAQVINAEFDAWNCQDLEGVWQAKHWQQVPYAPAILSAEYSFFMPPRPDTGPWESLPVDTYTMSDSFYIDKTHIEIIITVENMVKSIIQTDGFPTLLDAKGTNNTHIIITDPEAGVIEEKDTYSWVLDVPFLIEDGHHPKYCTCK